MNAPAAHPQVLVVDDEKQIRRLLRVSLEAAGYGVTEAATGQEALVAIAAHRPDAIVLDLGLPDLSGESVVRQLREWSSVPVLILSVLAGEDDKVAALDAGADDYLTKPFGALELTARLRALLRRTTASGEEPATMDFGDLTVDLAARSVRRRGAEVSLTPREYAMLRLLVTHRGKVVTHRQMLREIWGPKAEDQTHYLRVHMTHLRQKLEADPHQPRHLRTESGIGFRFVSE
jgi:two-component system KDP operon response regulator KdpE